MVENRGEDVALLPQGTWMAGWEKIDLRECLQPLVNTFPCEQRVTMGVSFMACQLGNDGEKEEAKRQFPQGMEEIIQQATPCLDKADQDELWKLLWEFPDGKGRTVGSNGDAETSD